MADTIKLYNTKGRELQVFEPIHEGAVSIYSCGPTVYHYQHLGNMRAAVFADTLHRMFVYAGYDVKHIINITDVGHLTGENEGDANTGEDKLEKGAAREGKSVWEIAKKYTDAYFKDLTALNVSLGDYLFPRATDHIQEQIDLVKKLEEKGFTYTISDGVYFDTAKFKAYPDFAHLDVKGLQAGARVEENTEKRNITDFALWKFSPKESVRQMEWDSPWGKGFPGWHIECSAMAMKYLGNHFDIHTGGIDHIPVHHTNEIAQSECATGETYVNYWLHNNFLNDAAGKMAKSSGDFLRLQTLIDKGYSPLVFRYQLLTVHYRKELQFSFESLDAARVAYEKLVAFAGEHAGSHGVVQSTYKKEFTDAMYDDLNTPRAIGVLWTMIKDDSLSDADKRATLLDFDRVLGLGLTEVKKMKVIIPEDVQSLLDSRAVARARKDFEESDRLRDEIARRGYTVKDTAEGQKLEK
jgi:cysteinyl-tRNA synthetase